MKFNTITFDANLPTTQQVNVPTNSDYKVGMKVKRNGSVQSIKPSEFTVYTGEVNVIPPTDYNGASKDVTSASESLVLVYQTDATAEMNSKTVKAKDIRFEASYDDGTTWQEVFPTDFAGTVSVIDRSAGTNNYVASMDPRVPKWYLLSGGQVVGEAAEITMPTTFRFALSSTSSGWALTSFPCKFRIVIPYGGYEEKVTYPVDQEKTNGYVTITKASGDEATFKQYGVHIDKGYDYNDNWKVTGKFGPTETTPPANFTKPSAKELGIVGITIDGEQFANTAMKITWSNATTPAPANPDDWGNWRSFNINTYAVPYQIGYEGETAIYLLMADPSAVPAGTVLPDGTMVQEGYNFLRLESGAQSYSQASTTWTLTENSYIYQGASRFRANYYFGTAFKFQLGTPFSADFKLNINEFKSQSGDIAETLADGSSVKVDGTYADGTTFSFDFCTK